MPYVAMAVLAGGNVRVGLEDNLYLGRGELATNAQLVGARRAHPRGDERPRHDRAGRARQAAAARSGDARCRSAVGLLGGGVIGGGWAARFLLNGVDVAAVRPRPGGAAQGRRGARQRPSGVPPADDGAAAARGRADVRRRRRGGRRTGSTSCRRVRPSGSSSSARLLARGEPRPLQPTVVFASSTSGLLPSALQEGMAHPERLVVGHPFNPVYLLPLVEVCGGAAHRGGRRWRARRPSTASLGMRPLVLDAEIDGFVADRLLEALWREALWLVNDGVATVEEIDDAIRFGAGLRWSFMGTFLDLPHRRWRGRHAPLPGPVRAGAAVAVDEADGRPRAHRRAASTGSSRSPTSRPLGARSASSKRCATTAWSP